LHLIEFFAKVEAAYDKGMSVGKTIFWDNTKSLSVAWLSRGTNIIEASCRIGFRSPPASNAQLPVAVSLNLREKSQIL
jgi:hypothetical protein